MTFCATWVVVRMVATHFLKPVVGCASGTSGCNGWRGEVVSTTCFSVAELSNQKRHVTCKKKKGQRKRPILEGKRRAYLLTSAAN